MKLCTCECVGSLNHCIYRIDCFGHFNGNFGSVFNGLHVHAHIKIWFKLLDENGHCIPHKHNISFHCFTILFLWFFLSSSTALDLTVLSNLNLKKFVLCCLISFVEVGIVTAKKGYRSQGNQNELTNLILWQIGSLFRWAKNKPIYWAVRWIGKNVKSDK